MAAIATISPNQVGSASTWMTLTVTGGTPNSTFDWDVDGTHGHGSPKGTGVALNSSGNGSISGAFAANGLFSSGTQAHSIHVTLDAGETVLLPTFQTSSSFPTDSPTVGAVVTNFGTQIGYSKFMVNPPDEVHMQLIAQANGNIFCGVQDPSGMRQMIDPPPEDVAVGFESSTSTLLNPNSGFANQPWNVAAVGAGVGFNWEVYYIYRLVALTGSPPGPAFLNVNFVPVSLTPGQAYQTDPGIVNVDRQFDISVQHGSISQRNQIEVDVIPVFIDIFNSREYQLGTIRLQMGYTDQNGGPTPPPPPPPSSYTQSGTLHPTGIPFTTVNMTMTLTGYPNATFKWDVFQSNTPGTSGTGNPKGTGTLDSSGNATVVQKFAQHSTFPPDDVSDNVILVTFNNTGYQGQLPFMTSSTFSGSSGTSSFSDAGGGGGGSGGKVPNGPASLGNIVTVYGGNYPASLGNYYAGGAHVANPAPTSNFQVGGIIPLSGDISIGNFFGTGPSSSGPPPPPPPPPPSPTPTSPFGTRNFNETVTLYHGTGSSGNYRPLVSGGLYSTAMYYYPDAQTQVIFTPTPDPTYVDWRLNSGTTLVASDWQVQFVLSQTGDTFLTFQLSNDASSFVDIPSGSPGVQWIADLGNPAGLGPDNTGTVVIQVRTVLRRKSDGALYTYSTINYTCNCVYGGDNPDTGGGGGG